MFRALIEEAAALASLALFLGMIAIWAQIVATLGHVPRSLGISRLGCAEAASAVGQAPR